MSKRCHPLALLEMKLDLSKPEAIPVEKFEELHISDDESVSDQDIQLPSFDAGL